MPEADLALRLARRVCLVGVLSLPFLVLRVVAGLTVSDLLLLSALGLALLSRRRTRVGLPASLWMAAYLATVGGIIATMRADSPFGSILVTVRLCIVCVALPWLFRAVLTTDSDVHRAAGCWIVGAAIFAVVSLAESEGFTLGLPASGSDRYAGLAGHVTDAGGILSTAAVFVLPSAITGSRKVRSLLVFALLAGGIVLAGSVSGFIAVGVGSLVVLVLSRVRLRLILAVGASAWAAVFLPALLTHSISPLARIDSTTSGRYDTAALRAATDHWAWAMISHQPFIGRGLDGASGVTGVNDLAIHNMLLLAWYQGGILVLVGVLMTWWTGLRACSWTPDLLALRLTAALVASFTFAMTSPLLYDRYIWLPVFLLVARRGSARRVGDRAYRCPSGPRAAAGGHW